jgi:hypothetical protein
MTIAVACMFAALLPAYTTHNSDVARASEGSTATSNGALPNGVSNVAGPIAIVQSARAADTTGQAALTVFQDTGEPRAGRTAVEVIVGPSDKSGEQRAFRIFTSEDYPDELTVRVDGLTSTEVLEITGGSDLAEPFAISNDQKLAGGSVVIIDSAHPGKLTLSHAPYDKKVAGIVSGAGGIQPGLSLKQTGTMQGDHNVALSGRVYVMATAANGTINPGDLLTTSGIPGHAMKVTDNVRANGAILGKAMGSLYEGEGLVLVLVNLQ